MDICFQNLSCQIVNVPLATPVPGTWNSVGSVPRWGHRITCVQFCFFHLALRLVSLNHSRTFACITKSALEVRNRLGAWFIISIGATQRRGEDVGKPVFPPPVWLHLHEGEMEGTCFLRFFFCGIQFSKNKSCGNSFSSIRFTASSKVQGSRSKT